ncbi:hypothetical protein Q3G72_027982 [Acer saccharum]|nr:hypothetical protein Q3G72_027982 [Acer saccharum]
MRNSTTSVHNQTRQQLTASPSRSHAQSPISRCRSAISVDHPSLPIVVKFTKPKSPLARQQLTQSRPHQYTTPAGPRLVDDQPFRSVVADQPSSAVASIFSISHRWRTVSSQAAALHAVACGSVVITMLDKPTVHAVEV